MTPDVRGLEQLERTVLDDTASLATALRQCLMLAGYAHHADLRAWALKSWKGTRQRMSCPRTERCPQHSKSRWISTSRARSFRATPDGSVPTSFPSMLVTSVSEKARRFGKVSENSKS